MEFGKIDKIGNNPQAGDLIVYDGVSFNPADTNAQMRKNSDNISLNAFRTAINGSLNQFGMVDGIIDEYQDELGVNNPKTKLLLNFEDADQAISTTDESPLVHSITFNGDAQVDTAQFKFGTASCLFDGTGDYLSIPNTSTPFDVMGSLSDSWTVEMFVRFTNATASTTEHMIAHSLGSPVNRWSMSRNSNENIIFQTFSNNVKAFSASGNIISNITIADTNFHHVAFIKVGTDCGLYIDGIQTAYDIHTVAFTVANDLLIGAFDFGTIGSFFPGHLDSVRINNSNTFSASPVVGLTDTITVPTSAHVVTDKSINISYNSTDDFFSPSGDSITVSPFAHMALENNTDDGSGANAVTDIGTPTFTSATGASQPTLNNALTLDGSTDALNLDALQSDITSDTTGSIALWFNTDTISSGKVICSFGDTSANGDYIQIAISGDGRLSAICVLPGVTQWFSRNNAIFLSASTWFHVVIVQDGVSPKVYLDSIDVTNLLTTTDTTLWMAGIPLADNGRLGCQSINNNGNATFFDGQIDDFRYYQNIALTQAQVDLLYNSGSGTEADQPKGTRDNMTLQSNSFPAQAQADNARIMLLQEDVDSIILNTDLIASVSRDGGTTFSPITLVNEGEYETGRNLISASVDISGQPSGTEMVYKLETANNKDLKIHGSGLSWN